MGKAMPDSKHLRWGQELGTDADDETRTPDATLAGGEPAANDADGWQQYRHWISRAPAPQNRRAGIDPALYSWKGYREWTDQVRRNWTKDAAEDSD